MPVFRFPPSPFFGLNFRGFTKFSRTDYVKWKQENRIIPDGVNAKVRRIGCFLLWLYLLVQLLFSARVAAFVLCIVLKILVVCPVLTKFCSNFAASWLPWTFGTSSTWKSIFRSNYLSVLNKTASFTGYLFTSILLLGTLE